MNIKQLSSLIWVICFLGLPGCTKDVALPDLEGSLVGYVYTFDEFAGLLDNHSGVLITALGLHNTYRTSTDADGRFEFRKLPAGTYELHIEKAGFGTMKQYGIKHLGGEPTIINNGTDDYTESFAFFLYEPSTSEILDLTIDNDTLRGNFSFAEAPASYITVRLYLSSDSGFNMTEAQFVTECQLYNTKGKYVGTMGGQYMASQYPGIFKPGKRLFFRARIHNNTGSIFIFNYLMITGINSYYDFETHETIYPNIGNASDQFSFVFQP
jgi:hypothetical protein